MSRSVPPRSDAVHLSIDLMVTMPAIVVGYVAAIQRSSVHGVTLAAAAVVALNLRWCCQSLRRNALFAAFQVTSLVFLLGRQLTAILLPEIEATVPRPRFSAEVELETSRIIFFSLLAVALTYRACTARRVSSVRMETNKRYQESVRRLAQLAIYVTITPFILGILERSMFVLSRGYQESYVTFRTNIPLVITRIGGLYEPALFLFLATFPARPQVARHLIVFVGIGVLTLGYGQRNEVVLNTLFALIYLAIRDIYTPTSTRWLSNKLLACSTIAAIPFIAFLSAFSGMRSNIDLGETSVPSLLGRFFVTQGGAAHNLSHSISLQDSFPNNRLYSLGPAISFVQNGKLTSRVLGTDMYEPASPELANEGHNFSFALAYRVNPRYYARGGGYGSSYLAELWIDGREAGVLAGSVFYGLILARIIPWASRRGPYMLALALAGMMRVIYAPRAEFLGLLLPSLSISTAGLYLTIHVTARHLIAHRKKANVGRAGMTR